MLAAILICGAMTMLTSCSVDDNPVDSKTLASRLVGEWIMEHDMDGMDLFVEDDDIKIPTDADMFTCIYHFDADGKGWKELVILKDGKCISSVISRYGDGEFTYTIDKNGKVLVDYIWEEIGDELTFDGKSLTTMVRGRRFNFVRATKEQIEKYKAEADALHGGSDEQSVTIPYSVTASLYEAMTRANVDNDNSTIRFDKEDMLYVSGYNNSGRISGALKLKVGDDGKTATFSGNLKWTGSGTPADDLELTATLVSDQQTETREILINSTSYRVMVTYPTTFFCSTVQEAVQLFSQLKGTWKYGEREVALTQQTAFLNFVITFGEGTAAGETLTAVVSNDGSTLCSDTVTTVTEGEKVVAKFVLPVESGTRLSDATVKIGSRKAIAIDDNLSLSGKVHDVKKTQEAKPLDEVTAADLHKCIGADSKIYETAAAATRAGIAPVALICYLGNPGSADPSSARYKGLALALKDADGGEGVTWCDLPKEFWYDNQFHCMSNHYLNVDNAMSDMAGIANTDVLFAEKDKEETRDNVYMYHPQITGRHNHPAATVARNYKYNDSAEAGAHPEGTSTWFLPSLGQWYMMVGATNYHIPDWNYKELCEKVGMKKTAYWSSTEYVHNNGDSGDAWEYQFDSGALNHAVKYYRRHVRAVLAF